MTAKILPQPGTLELAPSILSADFANLANEIRQVTNAGAKMVHLDVMDGHFVPNITLGPPVVAWIRKCTEAFLDTHLMITDPEQYAEAFVKAGSDLITFHIETVKDPGSFIKYLREKGVSVGLTLNPPTPVETIEKFVSLCDMVLIMTVNPGFGAQAFIDEAARKCRRIRQIIGPTVRIEVDGGINQETIAVARDYGADTFVAGNAIFAQSDRAAAIKSLMDAVQK
ncbi:MAG: ribulose-phosphate 3-epimerase [Planctomycetes bacterium]|nr:ribulose-phosphate 3-epimerase [Planctomycetota bacterium]